MCVYFKNSWGWVGGINPCKPGGMDCPSQEREVYIHFRTGAIRSLIVVILHRGKRLCAVDTCERTSGEGDFALNLFGWESHWELRHLCRMAMLFILWASWIFS